MAESENFPGRIKETPLQTSVTTINLKAMIWSRSLPNTKQESYTLNHDDAMLIKHG